jgi:hypothetical protein
VQEAIKQYGAPVTLDLALVKNKKDVIGSAWAEADKLKITEDHLKTWHDNIDQSYIVKVNRAVLKILHNAIYPTRQAARNCALQGSCPLLLLLPIQGRRGDGAGIASIKSRWTGDLHKHHECCEIPSKRQARAKQEQEQEQRAKQSNEPSTSTSECKNAPCKSRTKLRSPKRGKPSKEEGVRAKQRCIV